MGAVVLDQHLSVDVQLAAVVGRQGEVVFLLLRDLEFGFKKDAEMVLGIVYVHQVDVFLDPLDIRFAEGREVRQVSFRPVVPDLVVDFRGPGAGGQKSKCRNGKE